jgi:AcrR family transcriptional regulator
VVRADAERNRAKVLEAASTAFAEEGLAVSIQAIARRAGVGTGTVSRHFPTKDDLFRAIVLSRVARLVERAHALTAHEDPGAAFFEFFAHMVAEGAVNRGLSEALAGAGFDAEGAAVEAGYDVGAALRDLLTRAQQAGAIRPDVDVADVKALMLACLTRSFAQPEPGEGTQAEAGAHRRLLDVVRRGLQPGAD